MTVKLQVRYPDMPRLEHGVHVEITPDIARQIVALAQHQRVPVGGQSGEESTTDDDAATLYAIADCWCEWSQERTAISSNEHLLAAIKQGRIPGLWYNQQIATERDVLRHERDEARAEVERIKTRRVKLPAMQDVEGVSWYAAGHNTAIDACAAALREAGVEVE